MESLNIYDQEFKYVNYIYTIPVTVVKDDFSASLLLVNSQYINRNKGKLKIKVRKNVDSYF